MQSTRNTTALVIAGDLELVAQVEELLTRAGYAIVRATDGEAGLHAAWNHAPDIVLLDLSLPHDQGVDVCRKLSGDSRSRTLPLILIGEHDNEADEVVGLELGADHYMAKPIGSRVLMARIKSLLRRSATAPAQLLRRGELVLDVGARRVTFRGDLVALTPAEFRILQYLLERPARVHSREDIKAATRTVDADVMERAIDPHINAIRRKLREGGKCIETVRGFGYRMI